MGTTMDKIIKIFLSKNKFRIKARRQSISHKLGFIDHIYIEKKVLKDIHTPLASVLLQKEQCRWEVAVGVI